MADTIVQKKLSRLIQEEMGQLLSRMQQGKLTAISTVSQVKVTRDLSLAKIYISVFPDAQLEAQVGEMNEKNWELRHALAGRIRNKVRKIPELRFYADDSFSEASRINNLIDQLDILPESTDEDFA